jgi:hypothetical protein
LARSAEHNARISASMKRAYAKNPEHRHKRAETTRRKWQEDPEYRAKMVEVARKPRGRKPASAPRCCEWAKCEEQATIDLRFGKLRVRGKVTSLPEVSYCKKHAHETCRLFHVDRWVAIAPKKPKAKAKPKPKPKPKPELDALLDALLVPEELVVSVA